MKRSKVLSMMLVFLCGAVSASAQPKVSIVVTTPGYTTIYRYTPENFETEVKRDFRLTSASFALLPIEGDSARVELYLRQKRYVYGLSSHAPIVRLTYDRNRRSFEGIGFNYLENDALCYEAPKFKGQTVSELAESWKPQINRLMTDLSLLGSGENYFLLEAEIDECGTVHRIVEIGGGLRQYAKILIDHVYDVAVRGWEPAKRDGVPIRTVVQIPICVQVDKL